MSKIKVLLKPAIINSLSDMTNFDIDFNIVDPIGKLEIEKDSEGINSFIIKNAKDIGIGNKYNLQIDQASTILSIASSLVVDELIFSAKGNASMLKASLDKDDVDNVKVYENEGMTVVETELNLSFSVNVDITVMTSFDIPEDKLFDVINRLLDYNIFEEKRGVDVNVKGSISNYKKAINETDKIKVYKELNVAFEKAVNADKDLKGEKFDSEASKITKLKKEDIEKIRNCYNRFKHPAIREKQKKDLKECESKISKYLPLLKVATNRAILNRI